MKPIAIPFYAKLALVLFSIVCLGYLAILGQTLLAPLLTSFLLAMLLLPLAVFLENRFRLKRSMASIVSVLLIIFFVYPADGPLDGLAIVEEAGGNILP
jgi:putative permease